MAAVGAQIRARRTALRLSQEELGHRVGVTQGAVNQWEAGAANITLENLVKVAAVLGVDPAALLGEQPAADPNVSEEILTLALSSVASALSAKFFALPAAQQAKLLAYVYRKGGSVSPAEALALYALVT